MSKLKYGLGAIVIVGGLVGTIPYFTKGSIDTILAQKQKEMSTYGMNFNIETSTGYLNSKREITIKFENTAKVLDYIALSTGTQRSFLDTLTRNGDLLSEITFKGVLKNTNLLPYTIDSVLTLGELPLNLKNEMAKDKVLNDLIKSLTLNMSFNIQGEVTNISLNDINIEKNGVVAKLIKPEMKIYNNEYTSSIENITFSSDEYAKKLLITVDNINDKMKKTDTFNASEKATIESIKFSMQNNNGYRPSNLKYESKNHIISTEITSDDKLVSMVSNYNMDDIVVDANKINTKIKHFLLDIKVDNMNKKPIEELYSNIDNQEKFAMIIEPKIYEIFNSGFNLNLNTNVTDLNNTHFSSKKIDLNLNLKVDKNNITKYDTANKKMAFISINGTLKLDKEAVSKIPPLQKFNTNISNGISQFDLKFVNQKFEVNGQRIR